MEHGVLDAIRNGADKFVDKGLDLLRDTLFLVIVRRFHRHSIKRQKHSEDIEARTSSLESAVFKPNESGRELLANAKCAAAGQTVDLHSNGNDSVLSDRHRKP